MLHRAIGIMRPPPQTGGGLATSFDGLTQLATAGYFTPRARHRLAILLTDGESSVYRPAAAALAPLQSLAARTAGGRVYDESELAAVVRRSRAWLGHGPGARTGQPRHFELAPYVALAALSPVGCVLRRRDP